MPKDKSEENKNLVRAKLKEAIILVAIAAVSVLLALIFFSLKLTNGEDSNGDTPSLWSLAYIHGEGFGLYGLKTYLTLAFCLGLALLVVAAVISFIKRNKAAYYVWTAYNFVLDVVLIVLHFLLRMLQTSALVLIIIHVFVLALTLAMLLMWRRRSKVESEDSDGAQDESASTVSPKTAKACKTVMLICQCVAAVAMFTTLFIPICSSIQDGEARTNSLIKTIVDSSLPLYFHLAFLAVFVGCVVGLLNLISTFGYVKSRVFYKKSKSYVYGATFFTLAFFVGEYALRFVLNLTSKANGSVSAQQMIGAVPFVIALVSLFVHSIATGKCAADIEDGKVVKTTLKAEPLIYVCLMTVGLFASLLLNIVVLKGEVNSTSFQSIHFTGYKLLTKYPELSGGFQLMAFILFAILLTSSVMMIVSLFSLIAKNKDYYGIVKTTAFTNLGFALIVGLMGVYFQVAQKINEENIQSLLDMYGLSDVVDYTYTLKSHSIYVLLICGVVFAIMLFRKQFNLAVPQTEFEMTVKNPENGLAQTAAATSQDEAQQPLPEADAKKVNFDACPAFTELDAKLAQFNAELDAKRRQLFDNFTLPNLVRFVVDYARECRLHLSYSLEDMATFVAGLGASRLTILQGMSGTGKTSLPKIFTEAIMGVCEIVEVESSWRDKNELLGYYNEFSKCFTPKKFTQCLYKARLNSSALTLIVLDELNLSRIEYYFSDFLSLMEHEPDKREIKLLNIKLFRTEDGKQIPYKGLTDGHTIKIPQNVWFIGTANRDESTFAISDKVYDRAQTMNFNKRAPKIHTFSQPLEQKFVSYDMFIKLFEEAKANVTFDAESNVTVQKVEKILAPYNISFGNRILNQMEDFVKIYCACFGDKEAVLKEAVEKILLSKVVSKLENKVVENKDALAAEFERLGLPACADFVRKLNED